MVICPVCGCFSADHEPKELPALDTPAERAMVRKMLAKANAKLCAGKGLYAEASMIAGWLNYYSTPAPDAPAVVVAVDVPDAPVEVDKREVLITRIMRHNKFPRALAETVTDASILKYGLDDLYGKLHVDGA